MFLKSVYMKNFRSLQNIHVDDMLKLANHRNDKKVLQQIAALIIYSGCHCPEKYDRYFC